MKNPIKEIVRFIWRWYNERTVRSEYLSQQLALNERPIEYGFVFQQLTRTAPKTVLDVGTGLTALPHLMRNCGYLVTATDNVRDYWPKGMFNRHYHVINDDILDSKIKERFDLITCISVLEHIREHEKAVKTMFSLLRPGGKLVLTFPYNETRYIENVYKLPEASYGQDNPFICQVFSRIQLDNWLVQNQAALLELQLWQTNTGDFWTFGQRLFPHKQVSLPEVHHLACVLLSKPL